MTAADAATLRQIEASQPQRSTWLAANAGSGKTRVLTDRVARLLLDGVSPQRILCLTYTKAAASEMQNRLFKRLGEWAMKPDAELAAELATLGSPPDADLAQARTLFARAIETPGGLKIQTFHSFCASILRRFPLEAGVSPQFAEMEEQAAKLMRAEILEEIADGPQGHLIDGIAAHYTGEDLAKLCEEIGRHREAFAAPADEAAVRGWLGLAAGADEAGLLAQVFSGDEPTFMPRVIAAMRASAKVSDPKTADRLAEVDYAAPTLADFDLLCGILLTGKTAKQPFSAKIGTLPTKDCAAGLGDDLDALNALMTRVEAAREERLALRVLRRTVALHAFAAAFVPAYAARKLRRGLLDFDDLILGTRQLLSDSAVAQWVLYRLDGGIDHILVDEAQDTSPVQWEVIQRLTEEFTAGQGARPDAGRTIFAVGDVKQSIYSFQGADPAEFTRMRDYYAQTLSDAGQALQPLTLDHSFRSSGAILSLVDKLFDITDGHGVAGKTLHIAYHETLPGRVDLWPVEDSGDEEPDLHWTDPMDVVAPNHPEVELARQIARQIKDLCAHGALPGKDGTARAIHPGDFLILVRRRSGIYPHLIAEIKAAGIDFAGADRLKLAAELAVKDIAATLRFLATPEDDLSLASALRSPLFGFTEQQLFDLAHKRPGGYLWRALEHRADDFAEVHRILRDLRDQADFLRPYDLIERLLILHKGRINLLARLGEEAEEGLDILLGQALAYERSEVPSLTGFLSWLDTDGVDVKRQPDAKEQRVRVMTVHGAKGLEAPIVILPDTGFRGQGVRDEIVTLDDAGPVWKVSADDAPERLRASLDARQEREEEERRRLLYVAMTRAEQWLIVAGSGKTVSNDNAWYKLIQDAMSASGARAHAFEAGLGMRLESGDWLVDRPAADAVKTGSDAGVLPGWAQVPAPEPVGALQVLSPSDLGGAKAIGGAAGAGDEAASMRRGRMIHRLLEHLPSIPPADWEAEAPALLASGEEDIATPEEAALLLREARGVLDAPDLKFLFAPGTRAEIALAGPITALGGAPMAGIIDRLVVADDHVLAVDFKSNVQVPDRPHDVPVGLLRQMAAYADALAQIYPGRRIDTAIVWTANASLMPLPHDIVSKSLSEPRHLDDQTTGS